MNKTLNILLVLRTGGDFSMKDVRILADHLEKNKDDLKLNVWCLSDTVNQKVTLPNVTLLPMENRWPGWWAKMNLFSPKLEHLRPFMYLDLDTAVLKPITAVLPNDQVQSGVILLRDFYVPKRPATGLMWIPAKNNKVYNVWSNWIAKPEIHIKKFRGDQNFVEAVIKPDYYWQDMNKGIVSFKPNRRKREVLNKHENIVCFHGKPRIRQAAKNIDWVTNYVKGEL
jgi:hypothetical protein